MTKTNPSHLGSIYSGQTLYWHGSDQPNKLQTNLQISDSRSILESQGWHTPKSIVYEFNSHGFRDTEFDDRSCAMALGCSFTEGVGVDIDHVWPRVLSKMLNLHVWNLGIGGCALDTITRLTDFYLDFLRPKMVFLLLPSPWRLEFAKSENEFDVLLPNTLQSQDAGPFIKSWFAFDTNSLWNSKKNLLAIRYLCMEKQIPLFVLDTQQHGNDCLARDLLHPGRKYHSDIAQKFCQLVNN